MAHFLGTVQGMRGEASRLGSKNSGMRVRANGWRAGVNVMLYVNEAGEDCARVTITGGSTGARPSKDIFDGPLRDA